MYNAVSDQINGLGNLVTYAEFEEGTHNLKSSSPSIDIGNSKSILNDLANPDFPNQNTSPSLHTLRDDIGVFEGFKAKTLPRVECISWYSPTKITLINVERDCETHYKKTKLRSDNIRTRFMDFP